MSLRSNELRPVLVANSDSRKRQGVTVGQISWRQDAVLQVLADVICQKLEGVAEQGEEDDQPVDLSGPRTGKTSIAKSADGGMWPKVCQSIVDHLGYSHFYFCSFYDRPFRVSTLRMRPSLPRAPFILAICHPKSEAYLNYLPKKRECREMPGEQFFLSISPSLMAASKWGLFNFVQIEKGDK